MEQVLNHPYVVGASDYVNNFQWVHGETPFTSLLAPSIGTVVYLTALFVIPRIMKKRDALQLKTLCALHNLILCLGSLIMFVAIGYYVAQIALKDSLFGIACDPNNQLGGKGPHAFWYWIFYLSKYYEFVDTLFQLLRKKDPIFLHTYHHVITLWLVYTTIDTHFAVQWVDMTANAFVHVIMYYYYFLSEHGIQVWWKRYITKVQIVQFVVDITAHFIWLYYKGSCNCSGEMWVYYFGQFVIGSFLLLFIKFYYDSYKRAAAAKKKKAT